MGAGDPGRHERAEARPEHCDGPAGQAITEMGERLRCVVDQRLQRQIGGVTVAVPCTSRMEALDSHAEGAAIARALIDQVNELTPEELEYKGLAVEKDSVIRRLRGLAQR